MLVAVEARDMCYRAMETETVLEAFHTGDMMYANVGTRSQPGHNVVTASSRKCLKAVWDDVGSLSQMVSRPRLCTAQWMKWKSRW